MNFDASAASAITRANVQDSVSIRVARMALDDQQQQGQAVDALLASAEQVQSATSRPAVVNGRVDTYA